MGYIGKKYSVVRMDVVDVMMVRPVYASNSSDVCVMYFVSRGMP